MVLAKIQILSAKIQKVLGKCITRFLKNESWNYSVINCALMMLKLKLNSTAQLPENL